TFAQLQSWQGCPEIQGAECRVPMSEARTVSAIFCQILSCGYYVSKASISLSDTKAELYLNQAGNTVTAHAEVELGGSYSPLGVTLSYRWEVALNSGSWMPASADLQVYLPPPVTPIMYLDNQKLAPPNVPGQHLFRLNILGPNKGTERVYSNEVAFLSMTRMIT